MKKQIKELLTNIKCGDILKAELPDVPGSHICIVLNDDTMPNGKQNCLSVCNMTSSIPNNKSGFAINISEFDLPNKWFKKKKLDSWVFCNKMDKIWGANFIKSEILGNIDEYPEILNKICLNTMNCEISEELLEICDCKYEKFEAEGLNVNEEESDCGCEV